MFRRMVLTLSVLILILVIGSLGLMGSEHLSAWRAFYLTVETVTTVGYGDIIVHSRAGQAFLVFMMLGGVGVSVYLVGMMMAFLIEGQLADAFGRRKMLKKIAELKDHVIVCGGGRVGRQVLYRLRSEGASPVLIEQNDALVQEFWDKDFLVIHGDATQDETLKKVGILRAKGLITALPDDALNVFVSLTAKGLNPHIQVVARMDKPESEGKLLRAGADRVISPAILSGRRMAMAIVKPLSLDYLDTVIHDHDISMEIQEFTVDKGSCLVGKTLALSEIKQRTGAIVLAIMRGDEVVSNPSAQENILQGDVLIVLGLREQLERLEEVAANRKTLR